MSASRRAAAALITTLAIITLPLGGARAASGAASPADPGDPCPPLSAYADCTGVDVSGQSYGDAVIDHVILAGANMTDASFNGAVMWGADLTGADATGADLANANLMKSRLETTTFARATLSDADLTEAYAPGADFSHAAMREVDFEDATASGSSFSGADARDADFVHANLFTANFGGAELMGADFTGANLLAATLSGADLAGADLAGADLRAADLTNADLTGADLTFAELKAAVWSNTTCPDGRVVTGTPCGGGIARSESGFLGIPSFTPRMQVKGGVQNLTTTPAELWYSFFSATVDSANAPIFVMQNGGPGAATMVNLFANNTAPYTLNQDAIADAIAAAAAAKGPEPLLPFDPTAPAFDEDGNLVPPDDPNAALPDTTPADPTYVPNKNSWTTLGNVLYIDPALTGFSYNVSADAADPESPTKSFANRLAQMARGDNLNPWVDADQVLRGVLQFLDSHASLRDNPVVFVGESFGGVRVTTMMNMLLNAKRYASPTPDWPYSDPDLVRLITSHFQTADSEGAPSKARVLQQFGRQLLIQPQLSSYQGEVQGQMYYAKDSVIDSLAASIDGAPAFDRRMMSCPWFYRTDKNACVTRYWVPTVYNRDQYADNREASYTDDQELFTLTQLNNLGTLNVLLGTNVANIDGFTPDARKGKAYHSLGEGIEEIRLDGAHSSVGIDATDPISDEPEDFLDELADAVGSSGPLARILKAFGIDADALSGSRMTGKGTLNDELGALYEADEYVIAFNMAEWALYSYATPRALKGARVSADSDPIFGDMFLDNAKSVQTFLTDAANDLVIYSPALPAALAKHSVASSVVAVRGDTADSNGLGTFTITYPDNTKAQLYYPYYDTAGHAVAAGQPDKLRSDVAAWLTK